MAASEMAGASGLGTAAAAAIWAAPRPAALASRACSACWARSWCGAARASDDKSPRAGRLQPTRSLQPEFLLRPGLGRRLLATERMILQPSPLRRGVASMGPSPLGDGKAPRRRRVNPHPSNASMGPSPLGDGKTATGRGARSRGPASMGPSPLGDGKLQCLTGGHGFGKASMGPSPLGDGKLAYGAAAHVGHTGFNGAVASWRRKAVNPCRRTTPPLDASMGPSPLGDGKVRSSRSGP